MVQSPELTNKANQNTLVRRNQSRSIDINRVSAESSLPTSCSPEKEILPVFFFPQALHFYVYDLASITRLVKIYNPYDLPIRFKVLCTTQRKWEVQDPEAVISPNSFFELKVRLVDRSPSYIGKNDYLRIILYRGTGSAMLGKRDLPCLIFANNSEQEAKIMEKFSHLASLNIENFAFDEKSSETPPQTDNKPQEIAAPNAKPVTSKSDTQGANKKKSNNEPTSNWPPSAYILTAIMCGIVLCLPTEENILPAYLVISHTPKYIAAYVLGKHFSTAKQASPKQIGICLETISDGITCNKPDCYI